MGRRLGVGAALVDGAWIAGDVVVDGATVAEVGVVTGGGRRGGRLAVPGFVDLQVNGFSGVRFSAADRTGYGTAGRAMVRHGVTSYLATIPTIAPGDYATALAAAADAVRDPPPGSRPIGVHLEGPFLSPRRPGAHRPDWLRAPDVALAERWCDLAPVLLMTIAPELDGAGALVEALRRRGVVVAAGHSDATARQAHVGFDAGITMVTHLWNAQRPITSREAGLAGVGLSRSDVSVGMIADLVHLSPETLVVSLAAAGDRAVVVTDAAEVAGLPDGRYGTDDRQVTVGAGAVRLPDGTLAGSAAGLDEAVRNVVALGVPLERAVHAVTTAPAAALGRADVGRLTVGGRADIVVLDEELHVTSIVMDGTEV